MNTAGRWFVLTAHCPSSDLLPLVAEGLVALGATSVLEEGDRATTYLAAPADPEAFAEFAQRLLSSALPPGVALEVEWRWQGDEDWNAAWKRGLAPRKLTDRLVVKPSWSEWKANPHEIVIDIDPQMAFGTGEHATTRACLRLLERALRAGDRVLDVGSGSAVLSIAAARLGAAEVVAVESDPDANLNARENLARNGVADTVTLIEALAESRLLSALGRFDLIVTNILSNVIRPLLPAFRAALNDHGGRLIVSGILRSEYAALLRDANAAGFDLDSVDEEEEWWSGLLTARGS